MAFMRNSRFPPELTDMIIDHLCEDKRALSRTSLVAKSWLVRSRVHLFRTITVIEAFAGFAAFLSHNAHLARNIHHLILQGEPDDYALPSSTVILEPFVLSAILSQLPRLGSLQLHKVSFHGSMPSPGTCGFQLDQLIMMAVGSSNDTTNDILRILGLFSKVASLQILAVEQAMSEDDVLAKTDGLHIPHSLRVTSLKLEDVPYELYMQIFRKTESMKTLADVDVDCQALEDAEALALMLQDAHSSINTLALNLTAYFVGVYTEEGLDESSGLDSRAVCEALGPGVSACTNMSSLAIAISLDDCAFEQGPWQCIPGVLHSVSASSLKRIEISFASEEFNPLIELNLDWCSLAGALEKFSSIDSVVFGSVPGSSWCASGPEKQLVRCHLPELERRGLLQVGY